MNQQQGKSNGKRNLLIGGGVALAAVILVSQFGIDFPKSGDNATGTIAPADRYRAPQPAAQDVKVGTPSDTQGSQSVPAVQAGAANEAAGRASNEAAGRASNEAAGRASVEAAGRVSNEAANQSANQAANKAASQAANKAANKAANQAANKAANEAAGRAANEAMKK